LGTERKKYEAIEMDLVGITYLTSRYSEEYGTSPKDKNRSLFITMLSLAIGFYSVYLSWTCNSAAGLGTGYKVFWALCAWMFGTLYLIYYVLFRRTECRALKNAVKNA
jgi:hypothetical protein